MSSSTSNIAVDKRAHAGAATWYNTGPACQIHCLFTYFTYTAKCGVLALYCIVLYFIDLTSNISRTLVLVCVKYILLANN